MKKMKVAPKGKPGRPGLLRCRDCNRQFTVLTGTIFEDSHIPISKWILAIHLICASKKGMSAHQIHRMLGVTYKSAWFMMHRLRYAMTQEPLATKLRGIVEADETYIGGRVKRGRKGRDLSNKTAVVALVERGGRVRATVMPRVYGETVKEHILNHVDRDMRLMTDESNLYHEVGQELGSHETVKHSIKEYVRGDVHTNTVEGFFSLLKRGIIGVYHHVGTGHVHRYVDEFGFRYDSRKISDGDRAKLAVLGAEGKRLTYKQPAAPSEV